MMYMNNCKLAMMAIILIPVLTFAKSPTPPETIRTLYSSMEKLSHTKNDSEAMTCLSNMKYCFLGGDPRSGIGSGINVPNDFYDFGEQTYQTLTSDRYTQILYEKRHSLSVTYEKDIRCRYTNGPDISKYEGKDGYIETLITKTFKEGKKEKTFQDVVLTNAEGLIVSLSHDVKNGNTYDNTDIDDIGDINNIETLRVRASRYYTDKKYDAAYKCYKRILFLNDSDGDANYRIGLMIFWRKGYKSSSPVSARHEGIKYMEKAQKSNYYKADEALYYMTHLQIL